jgi:arylsulfatase
MGRVADLAMGFPGYCGQPPRENGFLSEILRAHGYATYAVGKWHLTPDDQTHSAADRSTWPLGRGFDRWYGFHGGETHQFVPALCHDNHLVRPPGSIEDRYHLSADLAERTIEFIEDLRAVEADKPFFVYLATGACHSPHHAPAPWIERYRGRFDAGWDEWRLQVHRRQLELGVIPPNTALTPRPTWVPAWSDLGREERTLSARFMECFAAFLSYTDEQLGRVLDRLERLGELDDTVVLVVSDNGASAEGGPEGSINDIRLSNFDPAPTAEMLARIDELGGPLAHNNYPWGWTMAGNTPFRRWKREVHHGGVADPCIVHWPRGLAASAGAVRHQFVHAIDVLPTVLELVGIETPDVIASVPQSPIDGVSFAYLLGPDGSSEPERHVTQYFEMFGSRAIYHRGWKAVTFHPIGPLYDDGLDPNASFDHDVWELYHVAEDLSETNDLAGGHPDKVAELVELWWEEAARNQVLPLDNRVLWTLAHPKPDQRRPRQRFCYFPHRAQVPEQVAANVRNRSHALAVRFAVADGSVPAGTLLALGSALGGWSLHVLDGHVRYVHNLYGKERFVLEADRPLGPGVHDVRLSFDKDEGHGGRATLACDGAEVSAGVVDRFTPAAFNGAGAGLTCGYEWGPAVGEGYTAPFPFSGTILEAVVEVTGPVVRDPVAELAAILSEQ